MVNDYTRIAENPITIIDYIISNKENLLVKVNIMNKISDHKAIDIIFECEREMNRRKLNILNIISGHTKTK